MHDHLESAAHVEVNAGAIGEAVDSEGKLLVLSSCNHECGYIVLLVQVIHIVKMIIEIGCRREMFFCQQVADAIDMVRYYYKKEVEANMAARKAGA